jgi:toxin YoeB
MRLKFEPQAFEDLQYWMRTDPKMAKRMMRLIHESIKDPYGGVGKPEPLKNNLRGWWSKRLNDEHRLIYRAADGDLLILQAKGHYDDK